MAAYTGLNLKGRITELKLDLDSFLKETNGYFHYQIHKLITIISEI
jgi:hypothetical protein